MKWLIVFAALFLFGCVGGVDTLKPEFKVNNKLKKFTSEFSQQLSDIKCLEIEDLRQVKISSMKFLSEEDLMQWISGAVNKLAAKDIPLIQDRADCVKLVLYKAYMKHSGTSISSVVVFKIKNFGQLPDKLYRGQHTSINWFGADGEYHSLLNKALEAALKNFLSDEIKRV